VTARTLGVTPSRLHFAMMPPVHRWDSVPQPRASVHVLHGMAEHGARYERFARALNAAGFNVWAHDHRGHGANTASGLPGHFADANGWRAVLDDVQAVSMEMHCTFRGGPLVLFAHSMGSFMAQALMARPDVVYRGIALSGTNGPPGALEAATRAIARLQRQALGARAPGTWLKEIVFGRYNRRFAPNRTGFDWLSRDTAEVDTYREDPRCGFALTTQAWVDFLEGKATLASPSQLQRVPRALPIHVIAGTGDPVGEETKGVERLLGAWAAAGLSRVTHTFYEGARHELLNETNRDEVTRDVIAWIDQVVT
jgi:alpha-beta hydrolase superfamily lysophospholipase